MAHVVVDPLRGHMLLGGLSKKSGPKWLLGRHKQMTADA